MASGRKFSLKKSAINTPRGKAIQSAMSELVAVPIRKGRAPYRFRLTSQTVLVKKLRPLCWIAGQAGVTMLSRIQRRVTTAATEATHVSTMKRSGRRLVFPIF
jgi:hypothetical protein